MPSTSLSASSIALTFRQRGPNASPSPAEERRAVRGVEAVPILEIESDDPSSERRALRDVEPAERIPRGIERGTREGFPTGFEKIEIGAEPLNATGRKNGREVRIERRVERLQPLEQFDVSGDRLGPSKDIDAVLHPSMEDGGRRFEPRGG